MSEEIESVIPKGKPLIGYCSYCGVEFANRILTNRWYKCDSCDTVQQVRIKTELDAGE